MKEILISQYLVCNKHLKVHTYIFNALRNNKNTTLPPIAWKYVPLDAKNATNRVMLSTDFRLYF